jgi:cholesterol transport system auxiliary component
MSGRHSRFLAAVAIAVGAALAGCATPDKPVRATLYDFGPSVAVAPPVAARQPSLVLAEIEASGGFEGSAMLYRLGYADSHQLRPYSLARWSAPPAQLVRHRLRQLLGQDRAVLDLAESASLARSSGQAPHVLLLDLEEFSQLFESEATSWGVVRVRATLLETLAAGQRLVAQRTFVSRMPASTADAAGGVRALTAATDATAEEIRQWLVQPRP